MLHVRHSLLIIWRSRDSFFLFYFITEGCDVIPPYHVWSLPQLWRFVFGWGLPYCVVSFCCYAYSRMSVLFIAWRVWSLRIMLRVADVSCHLFHCVAAVHWVCALPSSRFWHGQRLRWFNWHVSTFVSDRFRQHDRESPNVVETSLRIHWNATPCCVILVQKLKTCRTG